MIDGINFNNVTRILYFLEKPSKKVLHRLDLTCLKKITVVFVIYVPDYHVFIFQYFIVFYLVYYQEGVVQFAAGWQLFVNFLTWLKT